MDAEVEALARRAIACKGWRWMPGMRDNAGNVVGMMEPSAGAGRPLRWWYVGIDLNGIERAMLYEPDVDTLPDLTDPATLGAIMGLLRVLYAGEVSFLWAMRMSAEAFAESLVAALEAAP